MINVLIMIWKLLATTETVLFIPESASNFHTQMAKINKRHLYE